MRKIIRKDAFNEVVRAIEKGKYDEAQEMLKIVSWSIMHEKQNNAFTKYVLLKDADEERVFRELCESGKSYAVN